MTDERVKDLLAAVDRLPEGSGIVFRHYSLAPAARRSLFEEVKAAARARRMMLLLAGPADEAEAWGADGSHGRGPGRGLRSAPAHGLAEIRAAEAEGAALVFLSPVFATRSHPDAQVLGAEGFAALAAQTELPVVALGGMNESRFILLEGAHGWAGIDAWAVHDG
jgi:thiamine-phosphate pyrophosphorylase